MNQEQRDGVWRTFRSQRQEKETLVRRLGQIAERRGQVLVEERGQYVLLDRGDWPGRPAERDAQAAFAAGEGMTLDQVQARLTGSSGR